MIQKVRENMNLILKDVKDDVVGKIDITDLIGDEYAVICIALEYLAESEDFEQSIRKIASDLDGKLRCDTQEAIVEESEAEDD